MSAIDFLLQRFQTKPEAEALFWQGKKISYHDFSAMIEDCGKQISAHSILEGQVVAINSENFSPRALAWLFALARHNCIVVPGGGDAEIAEIEVDIDMAPDDSFKVKKTARKAQHPLLMELRSRHQPGLLTFSSGSSGPPKAGLHDFSLFLEKFHRLRPPRRMISFLLFDHIGGLNTMLACLSSLGCLVIPHERTPEAVAEAIEKGRAETLPTSPTFLNLFYSAMPGKIGIIPVCA